MFLKQICILVNNKEEEEEEEEKKPDEAANNGKPSADLDTKIKIAFNTIDTYVNKILNKYPNVIKKDEDLTKKFKKLKGLIANNINS